MQSQRHARLTRALCTSSRTLQTTNNDSPRDVVASADDAPEPVHGAENWIDSLFGHKPSDDMVPESCVDWVEVERGIVSV
jgi:hypothetical protein